MTILTSIISCSENKTKIDPAAIFEKGKNNANYLSMQINGNEWKADNEVDGLFHPKGYNNAVMMSGTKGPKDKNEQAFNLTLYNINGPGVFEIKDGNKENSVVQLAGLSEQNYLYGSMLGFNIKVTVTKASSSPTEIEASFEGELMGNAGDKINITNGRFYFHE
jgi:hypothetical protein